MPTGKPFKKSARKRKPERKPRNAGKSQGHAGKTPAHRKIPLPADQVLIYGYHAVRAALANPRRQHQALYLTQNALEKLRPENIPDNLQTIITDVKGISRLCDENAVHQGVLLQTHVLPLVSPDDLSGKTNIKNDQNDTSRASKIPARQILLALDQVTDPHNVGAILRSAGVFGAHGLIMTARNSPPLSGVLAKTASGGLEHVPVMLVPNLARTLSRFAEDGYEIIGLAGEADTSLEQLEIGPKCVLVLGSEEKGMRRLTRENCHILCKLSTHGKMSTLNVSNAAAVVLHHICN